MFLLLGRLSYWSPRCTGAPTWSTLWASYCSAWASLPAFSSREPGPPYLPNHLNQRGGGSAPFHSVHGEPCYVLPVVLYRAYFSWKASCLIFSMFPSFKKWTRHGADIYFYMCRHVYASDFWGNIELLPRITINALLILKVRDIIFFSRAKHIMGHFLEFLKGTRNLFDP